MSVSIGRKLAANLLDIPPPVFRLPMAIHPTPTPYPTQAKARHALPAVLMRAGTSKGLFIHQKDLPPTREQWKIPLLAAMGSKNNDPRQIDGVGGATSTTSKVAVVSPSKRPGIDVEYTFAQVAVGKETVDFSGNCGNMASGVGPFALDERLVTPQQGRSQIEIRIFNTNTSRVIVETLDVDENGYFREDGSYTMPGVVGTGSKVSISFLEPAGSVTGKLLPTGRLSDTIVIAENEQSSFAVKATMVDAANPFIFVDASTLPPYLLVMSPHDQMYLDIIELIRCEGAVMMGLARTTSEAALVRGTPKIAVVRPSSTSESDVEVQSFSMGKPHPSLQLTGSVCLGAAVSIEGTVPNLLSTASPLSIELQKGMGSISRAIVRIAHNSGVVPVNVELSSMDGITHVENCTVSRTARRLFEGKVLYYGEVTG